MTVIASRRFRYGFGPALALILVVGQFLTAQDVTSKLGLWWKFDENAGTTLNDSAPGNVYTGTIGALPAWLWTSGLNGSACFFSSNGVNPMATVTLDRGILRQGGETSNWTISCWIKISTWPINQWENRVWGRTGWNCGLSVDSNAGNMILQFNCVNTVPAYLPGISVTTNLMNSLWYHTAVTLSNRQFTLYLNGVNVAQASYLGTDVFYNYGTTFFVGGLWVNHWTFNGLVDDFRIYDRALSQADINCLVDLTAPVCAITNLAANGIFVAGATLSGTNYSLSGIAATRLIITNVDSGFEVYNQPVVADSSIAWHATPSWTGYGSNTAYLVTTNQAAWVSNAGTPGLPFFYTTSANVTVRTLDSNGVAWPGIRIAGPITAGSAIGGIKTSDANGEVVFSNQPSLFTMLLTNYAPLSYGGAEATLSLTVPTSNYTLVWTMNGAPSITQSVATAAVKLDPPVYFSALSPSLRFTVTPQVRNTISVIPLAKGMKVKLYEDVPGGAFVDLDSSLLKFMGQGVWIIEVKATPLNRDESKATLTRRLLFMVQ